MQANPLSRRLARRFVGGEDQVAAIRKIAALGQQGLLSSVYYLGEYVATRELVDINVRAVLSAAEAFGQAQLPIFLSVDPTQIGYSISEQVGRDNACSIGRVIGRFPGIKFMMLDMEDSSYVDPTIALYHTLRGEGVPVAITLQTYLFRTEQDFEALARQGAAIRLVKGAFVEGKAIAWTRKREIDEAYLRLARRALGPDLKAAGVYPILATHDHRILDELKPLIQAHNWQPDDYEFEMLLGVRTDMQLQLAGEGHRVRVYVPFGTEWWPYTARRIGEKPANARFVLQAFWGR
ncbi:MAG TPA: proline dehydrogenase family protein [Aggregatilineaceae bacterium]|nr:proline dehydrogenase family protein [Aggregatilineaceae bacterium]